MLPSLPERQFQNFIETQVSLFGDAEVLIVKSDSAVGYQLSQTLRRFTPTMFEGKRWLPEKERSKVNFNGRVINVTTFNCSTFSEINYPFTAGSEMEIFQEVARRVNLNYRFLVPKDSTFPLGSLKNGTWVGGLLGLLASGKADVGFCGLWIAHNKVNTGVEMSQAFRRVCLKYLVPRPVPVEAEWYGIFSPFSVQLWIYIAVAFVSISTVMPVVANLDSSISSSARCRYLSFGNSWVVAAGILMQGSWIRSSRSQGSCRHLIAWWTLFSLIVGVVFSGSLISCLTRPAFTAKPESLEDLVANGYSWTTTWLPSVDTMFNLNDPLHVAWTKRIRVVRSIEELHKALRGRNQVIWGIEMYGVFALIDQDLPDDIMAGYETMSGCSSEFYIGFGFRKGSPYKHYFNEQLVSMREAGLVHRAMMVSQERWLNKRRYMYRVTQMSKNEYRRTVLTLASLKGIFEFYSSGLLIATLVFACEITCGWISKCFGFCCHPLISRASPRNDSQFIK